MTCVNNVTVFILINFLQVTYSECIGFLFCSIFYEKEGFYCQPKELPDQEFGGVAVALGQKVNCKTISYVCLA